MSRDVSYVESDDLSPLLLGRRIVGARTCEKPVVRYPRPQTIGVLTLDDGTVIEVIPNQGCGGCYSGWADVESVAAAPNIITRVEVVRDEPDRWSDRWRLFVVAGDERINVVSSLCPDYEGDWYGHGFMLLVRRPEPAS